MRPHHIPINLLYHLGILQCDTPSWECAICIYDLQAMQLYLEVCMPRALFMLIEGVVIHTIFEFPWVYHKFLHDKICLYQLWPPTDLRAFVLPHRSEHKPAASVAQWCSMCWYQLEGSSARAATSQVHQRFVPECKWQQDVQEDKGVAYLPHQGPQSTFVRHTFESKSPDIGQIDTVTFQLLAESDDSSFIRRTATVYANAVLAHAKPTFHSFQNGYIVR